MTPLSCESLPAALESTSALLGVSAPDLERRLLSVPHHRLTRCAANEWAEPHETLTREALGIEPTTLPTVPAVLWFHATRVQPGTTFSEGLLPTHQIWPRLEAHLRGLAIDVEKQGPPCIDDGASYRLVQKRRGGEAAGPFAFLIRDVAANPSESRDFTRKSPEVVEELAFELDAARSRELCAAYERSTRRCIVWFIARQQPSSLLCRAVYYAYLKLHGSDVELANTCYSGGGRPIPVADLMRVEMLE